MVNFSVFNELSLPLNQYKAEILFIDFFKLLRFLKNSGLNTVRMSKDFKDFESIQGIPLQQFINQQKNREFRTRLKSFINNSVIKIESPLIQDQDSIEQNIINSCEYFYQNKTTTGGLACSDLWDTIAISFNSNSCWDNTQIILEKETLCENERINKDHIKICHAAKLEHLKIHTAFFKNLAKEQKLNIQQNHFWQNRQKYFPKIIIFCPEIEQQIKKLDKIVFNQAMSILREVETKRKLITDYHFTGEGKQAFKDPKRKAARTFMVNNKLTFFENHIKSFQKGYRLYFLEKNNDIFIGYIGPHPNE